MCSVFPISFLRVRKGIWRGHAESYQRLKQGTPDFTLSPVEDLVAEKIKTGEMKPHERLPAEDDLAAQYGVSKPRCGRRSTN